MTSACEHVCDTSLDCHTSASGESGYERDGSAVNQALWLLHAIIGRAFNWCSSTAAAVKCSTYDSRQGPSSLVNSPSICHCRARARASGLLETSGSKVSSTQGRGEHETSLPAMTASTGVNAQHCWLLGCGCKEGGEDSWTLCTHADVDGQPLTEYGKSASWEAQQGAWHGTPALCWPGHHRAAYTSQFRSSLRIEGALEWTSLAQTSGG